MGNVYIDRDSIEGSSCGLYVCPGKDYHRYKREERWEIMYVVSGTLKMHEQYEREFEVNEGEVLLLRPEIYHGGIGDYPQGLKYYWLHFYTKDGEVEKCENAPALPQVIKPARKERIRDLIHIYHEECILYNNDTEYKNLLIKLILKELEYSYKSGEESIHSALAVRIHMYIHTNFTRRLKTSDVASALGFNADYIERIFKTHYKSTITAEIQNARISHAAHQLAHSATTVSEIAQSSGFSGTEDFCRVFKKRTGLTPTQYRRLKTEKKYLTK